MLFSVSIIPIGESDSLAKPVARFIDLIDQSGLPYQVSAMNMVMLVIRDAYQRLRNDHSRVHLSIAVDDHEGAFDRLHGSVDDIDRELGREVPR